MEIFDICSEDGLPTGETAERSLVHHDGLLHRTAHVWITREMDGRTQVLLQKRSMNKDSFPGQFDTSSAGHIPAGSEPRESALRELYEELGISAGPEDLEFAGNIRIRYDLSFHDAPFRDNEVVFIFHLRRNVDIADMKLQKDEVDEVRWFDIGEVLRGCGGRDPRFCVPPNGIHFIADYLGIREEN